jgi:MFS family permease
LPSDNPTGEADWPAARLGWFAVLLLSLAALMSYVDRVVINLLIVPIQADFHLSDTQFAALQGVAFGLFYTVAAFPIGRLADGHNRRRIAMAGLVAFSFFSMASGWARSYWQLFFARTGVGVGEASLSPTAYSMLSDYFPPHRLGRAMGAFTTSAYFGMGLAYLAGGAVIGWLSRPGMLEGSLFAGHKPWQVTFMLVGLPGLLLLIPIYLFLREPRRRGLAGAAAKALPLREVGRQLWERRRVLGLMFAGFALVVLPGYAMAVWTPALFFRVFQWSPAQIGFWYGLLYMIFGVGGVFFAGWLCDRLTARGMLDAPIKVAAFGFVGFGLLGGLAPLMPSAPLALAMFAPAMFLSTMPYPLAAAAIQMATSNRMRAQTTAIYIMIINLVGLGLGPVIVALFTENLFSRPEDVRYSMAIVNAFCGPAAMILLLMSAAPFRALRSAPST